ncbi:MAG: 50S ribosomal protein L21 [Proteobacteria bacterium]|nr:50S ribosomal protein L21 [Pseudomonadota bacterium]
MYAVIMTGGKQYKVFPGEKIKVEKLNLKEGETITFDVLMLKKDDDTVQVGTPVVEGASVIGKVLRQGKAKKILVFKKKRRKNYSKLIGHRQPFTELLIEDIKSN